MEPFLNGKHAVVTGGTRGIGRAIADHLLRAGATVAICGRTRESVDQAAAELKQSTGGDVVGIAADVSNQEEATQFFRAVKSRFDGLDILINNAGIGVFRPIQELTVEDWHKTIGLNLSGVFYCCHHALPLMRKRGAGYIIQISSLAGV